MTCLIIAALINCIYHKSIGCMPFCYLHGRDPQASTLVAPALKAIVEPLFDIKVSKAEDEDLDGNKEILGPLPEENGDRREAAKQQYNKKDNRSITLSALIAFNKGFNKDYNNISNIGDNSNQLLTSGKSSNKEDKEEDYNLPNRLQRQETSLNYTLSNNNRLSPNYLLILI